MEFIQQPAYIIAVLLLLVAFSEWLSKKKFFRHLGSVLIIIIAAAILANLQVIPSSGNAPRLYNQIFEYAAPLGIFFLLLEVRLKDLRLAGGPMLLMFFAGSLATVAGVIAGYRIFNPQDHQVSQAYAVAGMFAGTYTGGSANLNAVALQYGVTGNGTLYAAVNAVDNIITTFWLMMTMLLPPLLQRWIPREKKLAPDLVGKDAEALRDAAMQVRTETSIRDISILVALGFATLFLSNLLTSYFPAIPSILVLTTIALVLAQLPFIQRLKGAKLMGMLLVMIFLAVIGAFCDIRALIQSGNMAGTLLAWDGVLIAIHGILIFSIGALFKQDWDIIAIASNANIGGATSAPVCAASLGRPDLQLPGLLSGSIGTALGTYLGILVAEFLK